VRSLVCGLIGAGIQGSRAPALHEQEAEAQGLRLVYQRIDLERLGLDADALPELLTAAERMGFAGLNITHPCKQAVLPLLHELSAEAQAIGAVNTVVFAGGRRIGYNTDASGFAESFKRGMAGALTTGVVLLGAGGAGAAVAHALLQLGAQRVRIFDLDDRRARSLAARLGARAEPGDDLAESMASADGLVHCSPAGMAGHPRIALPPQLLRPRHWVAEVVYVPLETELLRAARARGCRTMDGGGMAVYQAAGAFRLFTGIEPDAGRMLRHFSAMPDPAGRTA
jgi:shikimate dehydrogenase